jgi:NADPH-dependent curcumin reductase CurA
MSQSAKRVVLVSRPVGEPKASDFRIEDYALPTPGEGQVLLRTIWLSLDPYMRGRMSDGPSYAAPVPIGGVMEGGTVCEVIASNNPSFAKGDIVLAHTGWQTHALSDGKGLTKIDPKLGPVSTAVGVLGMPGMTAYTGLLDIGKPQPGETVVVAAASGAVGSAVGQIAKIKGARAVGIAGGKNKCDYVKKELGFDDCLDHRDPNLAAKLKEACPKGIDVYFENVGGAVFEAVFPLLNAFARSGVRPDRTVQRHRGIGAEMGVVDDAFRADQASDHQRLHLPGFRRASCGFSARHVGVGARGQGQASRIRHRGLGQRARRVHGASEGREFRQATGARRAGQGVRRVS